MTPFSVEALRLLRDPTRFDWYAVFFLALVLYVYAVEIEKRNWSAALAGLAFWCVDWINEVVNALVLRFTGHAALWTTTGPTSFQILVGLNLEICSLFAVSGVVFVKTLPKDPKWKVLGLPNRWVWVAGYSIFCVLVEVLLNRTGYFHWAYWWWNVPNVGLIVIFGYGTFFAAAAWVHDLPDVRSKLRVVGALATVAASGLVIFGPVLRWI